MLRPGFLATHSPPQPKSSLPLPLIPPPFISHSPPPPHTHTSSLLPIYAQNLLLCNLPRISCQMKFLFRKKKLGCWIVWGVVAGGEGSPCVEANNPASGLQVRGGMWLTGLDMRPSPHLTFGFHKVWNKRQGQNNQRGAQANKSVYSSSPAPLPHLCTPHARPHHGSTLGGERGRAWYYLFWALVDSRTTTAGHFRPCAYLRY